jgi:hypothetical protein
MNRIAAFSIALTLAAAVVPVAQAQDTPAETQRVAEAADREDRGEWGWLGLLGLAGLMGLKRRDRDNVRHDGVASSVR